MKQILALLFTLAMYSSIVSAEKPHGPLLVIDTASVCNFGAVPNDSVGVQRMFTFKNNGDEALRIAWVYPGCGCTVTSLSDTLVAPGASAQLKVKFCEQNHSPSPFKKEITVSSNSRDTSTYKIWFYGRIVAAPGWDGKRFVTTDHPHSINGRKETVTTVNK